MLLFYKGAKNEAGRREQRLMTLLKVEQSNDNIQQLEMCSVDDMHALYTFVK
jgi:hypothetical protein